MTVASKQALTIENRPTHFSHTTTGAADARQAEVVKENPWHKPMDERERGGRQAGAQRDSEVAAVPSARWTAT